MKDRSMGSGPGRNRRHDHDMDDCKDHSVELNLTYLKATEARGSSSRDKKEKMPFDIDDKTGNDEFEVEEFQLGVWKLKVAKDDIFDFKAYWEVYWSGIPFVYKLATDIYSIAPGPFVFFILSRVLEGVEGAFQMQFSTQLLRAVESSIIRGVPDTREIVSAMFIKLTYAVVVVLIHWYSRRILEVLRTRVTRHFDLMLLQERLKMDLATAQHPANVQDLQAENLFSSFEQLISFGTHVVQVASQLVFVIHLSRSTGGPLFALLSMAQPLFTTFFRSGLRDKLCFAFVNNPHWLRLRSLLDFSRSEYRQDIISNGLGSWLINEYHKAFEGLGDINVAHVQTLYSLRDGPLYDVTLKIVGDLPMFYCAANVILNPSAFSVASFAALQQTSSALRGSVSTILSNLARFRINLMGLKIYYSESNIENSLISGNVSYPREDDLEYAGAAKGMSFELRNISFSYPGSQKTEPALKDISLTIHAGQLVVVVGANGSGKSTLIRILSRLYDPSSGSVEIDGLPSKSYNISTLQSASALLSQDNVVYPLSLAENIGLGHPEYAGNMAMIQQAARDGGAWDFISKLKDGMDTQLKQFVQVFQARLRSRVKKDHPFLKEMYEIRQSTEVSGGEKQRIVAARTFMRFNSGKVKFVAVDEPTSALDAEGELKLFEKLIEVREGKTVVFVTHRFGHLTKHADQIICMKDGLIVERGKHEDLVNMKGEYAKLHDIQASAFSH